MQLTTKHSIYINQIYVKSEVFLKKYVFSLTLKNRCEIFCSAYNYLIITLEEYIKGIMGVFPSIFITQIS